MHSDDIYNFCLKNSYIIFSIYIIFRKKFEYL